MKTLLIILLLFCAGCSTTRTTWKTQKVTFDAPGFVQKSNPDTLKYLSIKPKTEKAK